MQQTGKQLDNHILKQVYYEPDSINKVSRQLPQRLITEISDTTCEDQ